MRIFLLSLLLIVSMLSMGQGSKTDVLHKLDQTTINAKIEELTDTEIIYSETVSPSIRKRIARNQVWKIVFVDGSTEIITALAGKVTESDIITLTDQTTVVGKVGNRNERKLYYTKPGDPTNSQFELLLTRIDKIKFASGKEELFSRTAGTGTVSDSQPGNSTPVATSVPAQPKTDSYTPSDATVSYTSPNAFPRLHVTIGPEFSYYADALNKDKAWLNDSTGFGMKQNVGASLRVDYMFFQKLGISLTAGYYGWELVRRYTREGVDEYTETKRLTQIPIQLGIKAYPFGRFYIMPEAGIKLFSSSFSTSDTHPEPITESASSTPIMYGGSIGCEFGKKGLLLDLSLRYQLLNVSNFKQPDLTINESLNIVSIRLGIGFNALTK